MNLTDQTIRHAILGFADGSLGESSSRLLNTLGYKSERVPHSEQNNVVEILKGGKDRLRNSEIELLQEHWIKAEIVCQYTEDELQDSDLFSSTYFDQSRIKSFVFVAADLRDEKYTRGKLAEMTRIVNRLYSMPVIMFYRYGRTSNSPDLTTALIHRRPHKRDSDKDVLEKVTLIKDIRINNPHRAHCDIINGLSLDQFSGIENFDHLHKEWESVLDTKPLNKRFYKSLFEWYEHAVKNATWPSGALPQQQVIRCVTRVLFVWFMKEKGLVSEAWFNQSEMEKLLNNFGESDYYRAVLQNLFFATLNVPIEKRGWNQVSGSHPQNQMIQWRYKPLIHQVERFETLMSQTPFINGGLFECLDDLVSSGYDGKRFDMFSDDYLQSHNTFDEALFKDQHLNVRDNLFFGEEGLFSILHQYKFTVEENTPTEIDVALDPELLGLVFENLLASHNPETSDTARKETGSFYTPREVVNYMVDEALITRLSTNLGKNINQHEDNILLEERLRLLFDYETEVEVFNQEEKEAIIRAISELKILDPAVGSGAFPMAILQKLTFALRQLDPDNDYWRKLQQQVARTQSDKAFETENKVQRDKKLIEISNIFENYSGDFGRKLYLIQNSIYGVDIQAIACQITKLRFFISLAIEQEPVVGIDNFGIKPLPNLETRFVAADSLQKLIREGTINNEKIIHLQYDLINNREKYFHANSREEKLKCKSNEYRLKLNLANELTMLGFPPNAADQLVSWNPYDPNDVADWFDPKYMFGIEQGFDIVIGNPPYISLQKDSGRLRKLYKNKGFFTFTGRGDIYQLFIERSCELLLKSGTLAFIISNSWLKAEYGKKLRNYLTLNSKPLYLLDVGKDIFEAEVDACILILQNFKNCSQTKFSGIDLDRVCQVTLPPKRDHWGKIQTKGEDIWRILSDVEWRVLEKMENIGKPLSEWPDISIHRGITTGCNDAFLIDGDTRNQLINEDPHCAEILKPVLRGRDIQRYKANWADLWLISTLPSLQIDIKDYPSIERYLLTFGKERLSQTGKHLNDGTRARKKTPHRWFELQDTCAYHEHFS
ncbi:MAG: Eco57I restriction-modification methylase domain-containing protein, partial [Bacteroidetes bacterium]|nr:Eco57I restriction-modification methylase domain-containing protein [Bacteroidota bacterium]